MPCESSLGYRSQPGLEFREHAVVRRAGRRWNRHVSRITRTTIRGLPGSLMDLGELADSDRVVRGGVEHSKEFGPRLLITTEFKQGAAQRHPGGQISGMLGQPRLADSDGFLAVASPSILFRKLRKSNRRRILLNPASKIPNPRVIRHA
jgi:hypothetical protein